MRRPEFSTFRPAGARARQAYPRAQGPNDDDSEAYVPSSDADGGTVFFRVVGAGVVVMGACSETLVVRVSRAEREHFECLARLLDVSMSEVVRQAMGLVGECEVGEGPPSGHDPRLRFISESRRPLRRP